MTLLRRRALFAAAAVLAASPAAFAQETAPAAPAPQPPPAEAPPPAAPVTEPPPVKESEKSPAEGATPPPLPLVPPEQRTGEMGQNEASTDGKNLDAPRRPPLRPDLPGDLTQEAPPPSPNGLEPLDIENADQTYIDVPTGNYVALGNVRMRFRGYLLTADRATFNENSHIATFESNVIIDTGRQHVHAEYIRLNLRTRGFSTRDGRTVVPPDLVGPNLLQPLRLSGETVSRVPSGNPRMNLESTGGFLTTCDYPHPHFRIGFRKMTIIPNQRMVLRDATLYQYNRRIFTVKYLSLPIRDEISYNYLPVIGRNNEEGYFMKTALSYMFQGQLPGLMRIDLMEKKGVGLGIDQTYRFGESAAGVLILYGLRDQGRDLTNWNGRLDHQQRFGDIFTSFNTDFQNNSYNAVAPGTKTQNTVITATRAVGPLNTNISLNHNRSEFSGSFGGVSSSSASHSTAYTITNGLRIGPAGNATLRLTGNESASGAAGGVETGRRDQAADLRTNAPIGPFTLELNANRNLLSRVIGATGNTGGFFSGTERLPEFTLSTDTSRIGLGWLKGVGARLGFGRYVENPGRVTTQRTLFDLDASPPAIPLFGGLSLTLGGGLQQTFYRADAAQYILESRSQLTQRFSRISSLNFTYGYLRPYGAPPPNFRLDQAGSYNNAAASYNIDGYRVRLSLQTGYDIQRARLNDLPEGIPKNPWQNLSIQLGLRPSGIFQTRFAAAYDLNSDRLIDLTNRFRIRTPGGFALNVGLRYDPRTKKLPQNTAALETPLFGGAFHLTALAGYNGVRRQFDYRNITLTRSFHDYEVTLGYVDQPFGFRTEKGFNLIIRLKALPIYQRTGTGQFGTALDTGTGEVF